MRAQRKSHWCGIAAIANALEVLGIKRSQREIARLCHVTPEAGTNETEMKRALLANGMDVDEWPDPEAEAGDCYTADQSTLWVRHCLVNGLPVVLCVDNDEHWVTAIGLCGDNFLLFDPARNTGVEVHNAPSLATRWVNDDGVYYGLGVGRIILHGND